MKNPYLDFLASVLSRLDPIYTSDSFLGLGEEPTHGDSHGAATHGGDGHHAAPGGLTRAQYAALLALLSGLSLPLGAALSLKIKPQDKTIARWMAIGAGALLFAVSVELYGHAIHHYQAGYVEELPMILMLLTSLFGAFFFTWISNQIAGDEGDDSDDEDEEEAAIPCPTCKAMVAASSRFCSSCGTALAKPGSPSKSFDGSGYDLSPRDSGPSFSHMPSLTQSTSAVIRRSGSVATPDAPLSSLSTPVGLERKGRKLPTLSGGSAFSAPRLRAIVDEEMGLMKGEARSTRPRKAGRGLGALMREAAIQRRFCAQKRWARLREAMQKYRVIRYMQKQVEANKTARGETAVGARMSARSMHDFWGNMRNAWGQAISAGPDPEVLSEIQKKNRAAALNVLAMLIVDGIPEGIVMGFMAASGDLGATFIISLFIANFPEAFAGGTLLLEGGFNPFEIICMWSGLSLLVASCAGVACHVLLWLNPTYTGGHIAPFTIQVLVSLTEGLAGGAMISGIAACMLPEAYERRDKHGAIMLSSGYLCTAGFMLSIGIKIILDRGH